jgi:nucleoside-diphosphate-sugar epimerase
MHVFLAGATGVIGRALVPRLLAAGHRVTALTRSRARAAEHERQGVRLALGDVFDRQAVIDAVVAAKPDAIVHQLTAIPPRLNPRRVRQELALTNRLRTEGTANLLAAGRVAGVERFVAQSIAFVCQPTGEGPLSEDAPLYQDAPRAFAAVIAAVAELERRVTSPPDLVGAALRYGFFYGPGTVYAEDGAMVEDVRRRRVPLVGEGAGVFSFVHVDDAAEATVLALERGVRGVYNIVDDEPAPVGEWLPFLAERLGAPPPRRVPVWLARLAAGPYAVYLMHEQRGYSNAKAKEALGWTPRHPSWRDGFAALLAGGAVPAG